jgi:methylenetetrahydrofolate reductase (NADPH)
VTSPMTAEVLRSFAGDRLPAGYLESITGAPDAEIAGIDAALELALSMLAVTGVDGVNLSAGAPAGYELAAASGVAEVARRLAEGRGGLPS